MTAMKTPVVFLFAGALFAAPAFSQTSAQAGGPAQASGQASVQTRPAQASAKANSASSASTSARDQQVNGSLASGSTMNAALDTPVDAKKAKPGDEVKAHTTQDVKEHGKTVIPHGTKLVGHVTRSSARAKGDAESAVAIHFDRALLKHGQEMPLDVGIRALAASANSVAASAAEMDTMQDSSLAAGGAGAAGGGRMLGGGGLAAGGAAGAVTNTAASAGRMTRGAVNTGLGATSGLAATTQGATGGLNAAGELASNSSGVFGIQGLSLNSGAENSAEGSVISSAGKNVHLNGGTRMLLVTEASAANR
jgi:hypothetical protein